jgi:quinol monooxygenase YgiN
VYGTIMRARVKPERRAEFETFMHELEPPFEVGFHGAQAGWEDGDENRLVLAVFFRDREAYRANADRQETRENYEKMLGFLDGGVEWLDVNWADYSGKPIEATAGARA